MSDSITRIAVTGGAGQIAYSLLFRLAAGELLGVAQPIALHILEVPEMQGALEGVKMELEDSAFPLLREIKIGSDPRTIFTGVHYAFLVGAKPRGPGMERKELLAENAKIFVAHGSALNDVVDRKCKILVVGNPCNTNCLIAIHNAPNLHPSQFQAMTRLDQNRAMSLLATKAEVPVTAISNVTIWGNHSNTQVPDYFNAMIDGKPAVSVISDNSWLEGEFFTKVQGRGAEIIRARGKSSAASAASSALDAMKALTIPTEKNSSFASAVYSDNNPYGIQNDLVFSFPCISRGLGEYTIKEGFNWNSFLEQKIKASQQELIEERELVHAYFKSF